MKRFTILFIALAAIMALNATDPTATTYTFSECLGSSRPYPAPEVPAAVPDSLEAVFINHVGRHGARFPASPANTKELAEALRNAETLGTITPKGRRLLEVTDYVADRCHNYWGALDSLGMAEERGIASRMFIAYPKLFTDGSVSAISSFVPRCVMSMYVFNHQLDRLNNKVELSTASGRRYSDLLRPFDLNGDYRDYIASKVWQTPLSDYQATQITAAPLRRLLGKDYPLTQADTERLALAEYHFVASLPAMGLNVPMSEFFSLEEANALWSCFNLRQYLQRVSSTLSSEPADIASPLLLDLIRTTDLAVEGKAGANVMLRFGHAETLLPLFSLLRLPGCYYLTNYFDTVASHFRDFDIVPMAANLQIILFKVKATGDYCVRFDLNERPIAPIPNDPRIYIPWDEAREYMVRCLPLIDRP